MVRNVPGFLVPGQPEVIVLRQDALEFRFVFLNGLHRLLERLGDVFLLREIQEVIVARVVGQVEAALLDGDVRDFLFAAGVFEFLVFRDYFRFVPAVVIVGELKEYQAQNRRGILAGFEIGICTEIVRGCPEIGFELFKLFFGHFTIGLGYAFSTKVRCSAS